MAFLCGVAIGAVGYWAVQKYVVPKVGSYLK
jgi:hypothetical protein